MTLLAGAGVLFIWRFWRNRTRITVPLVLDRAGLALTTRLTRHQVFVPWEIVESVTTRPVVAGAVFTFTLRPSVAAHHAGTRGFDVRIARQAATRDGLYVDTRWLTADRSSIAYAIAVLSAGRVRVIGV
jgi:hypothetical protein